MSGKGRRTKCTPERVERICKALRAGNYIDTAAKFAGITATSYHNWAARARKEMERRDAGEEPDPSEDRYVYFLEETTRARAAAEVEAVAQIRQAAREDWRAAAWYLEHGHSATWGKRQVDVTSNGQTVFTVSLGAPDGEGE